jgi:Tim17/Tim22/Tim23/Pmp24 family
MGQTIAGLVQISLTVLMEYISGYVGGYVLGTVVGLPGFFTKPSSAAAIAAASSTKLPLWNELGHRAARMHQRSYKWAGEWGFLSAAFGGSSALVKIVRGNDVQDEWNTILSSMIGAAILRRKGT